MKEKKGGVKFFLPQNRKRLFSKGFRLNFSWTMAARSSIERRVSV